MATERVRSMNDASTSSGYTGDEFLDPPQPESPSQMTTPRESDSESNSEKHGDAGLQEMVFETFEKRPLESFSSAVLLGLALGTLTRWSWARRFITASLLSMARSTLETRLHELRSHHRSRSAPSTAPEHLQDGRKL